jgi:hypothetical protein
MTNERLGYGMVVWITVRRHPPVVAIRAAETAMPIGGIRFLAPSWKRAGHVRYVWASIGENARGRVVVMTRLARWLEERAGSEYEFGLVRHVYHTL